jgi:hypothetical protein
MLGAWSEAETGVGKVALISLFTAGSGGPWSECVVAFFFPAQGIECIYNHLDQAGKTFLNGELFSDNRSVI